MTTITINSKNAAQASARYCRLRELSGQGASTWPEGHWNGHLISYNGRVWNEAGKAIYPTKEDSPEIWKDSCA